jgi:molecular chaperone GrpE
LSKNKEKGKQPQEEEVTQEQQLEQETPCASAPEQDQPEKTEENGGTDPISAELKKLKEELSKQKDLLLRTAAEYENFRKRTEREKRAIYTDATADAVAAILPIADSLEFAVKAQDGATEEYQKGLELVNKQFQEALGKLGVTAIGEAGQEFDPALHNAVAHVDDDTVADNIIVEVFQKGYVLGEKVIRHAMVKVAN